MQLFKKQSQVKVFICWACMGSVLSLSFFLLPLFLLLKSRGCDENAKNRITFYVNDAKELYVMPLLHYWSDIIRSMYSKDFSVKFETPIITNHARSFVNVRYDFNFMSFTFECIGYLALVELIMVVLHNIILTLDFFTMFKDVVKPTDDAAYDNPVYILEKESRAVVRLTHLTTRDEEGQTCENYEDTALGVNHSVEVTKRKF